MPPASARRTRVGDGSPTDPATPRPSAIPGRSMPTTRPWSRTTTRSIAPRIVASCSTHRIAVPPRASSVSRAPTSAVPAGSSWAVGSSRTRTSVPIATMLAIATRCCSPPDSANGSRSARWAIPRRASTSSIRASMAARGMARFSRPNASSSRTVGFDAESWLAGVEKTIPTRPSRAPGVRRRRVDAVDRHRARQLGADDPRDEAARRQREGRFAGAGPAGDPDELARSDGQIDAGQRRLAPPDVADLDPGEAEAAGLARICRAGHRQHAGHGDRPRPRHTRRSAASGWAGPPPGRRPVDTPSGLVAPRTRAPRARTSARARR